MKLWFGDNYGKRRIIADCNTPEEVSQAIDKFIAESNKKKPPGARPFKRYYTRVYEEDGLVKYDVSSHTEFFYWEGSIDAYRNNNSNSSRSNKCCD